MVPVSTFDGAGGGPATSTTASTPRLTGGYQVPFGLSRAALIDSSDCDPGSPLPDSDSRRTLGWLTDTATLAISFGLT
jgi:hypothetical protein